MLKRRDRDRIVISAESMFRMERAAKGRLVGFIRRHGWEVEVIAYLRDPAIWASHLLSNLIRSGKTVPCKLDPAFRLGIEPFMERLPPERVHVRHFPPDRIDEGGGGGDPVTDFCEALDLDFSRVMARHANPSLSLPAMKLLYCFNRLGILCRFDPKVSAALGRFVAKVRAKYAGMGKLDPALCEGIADYSDTEWLYEKFGIDFRRKAPARYTKADLEAALGDLSGVDLAGLDELLAEHGIRHEDFATVEHKLQRLFFAELMEHRPVTARVTVLLKNPRSIPLKIFDRMVGWLLRSRLLSSGRRNELKRMARKFRGA